MGAADTTPGGAAGGAASSGVFAEVRYSLPVMLEELKLERSASVFSMERLDQVEIGKLFKSKQVRRAKPKK